LEELLHHIKELVILINVDSRVLDDEASVVVKRLSHGLAVLGVVP
jgi:hypothetical protein